MKIAYIDWNPKPETVSLLLNAEQIITEYQEAGYVLTVRQLYYQFVARDLIENSERSYNRIVSHLTKARLAGLISWEAIEDRNREHQTYWTEESDEALIGDLYRYIRFDRWARQPVYVEVWVEKEALGNVVARACDGYHVPHLACKGYLSASEAWRAGQRIERKLQEGKRCVVVHLGDHDPSGIDMTRDNRDRLRMFTNYYEGMSEGVEVRRIALNIDQVEEYAPPPNPAKLTDSRIGGYLENYGSTSWELDALEPQVIQSLIEEEICRYIDWDSWHDIEAAETEKKDLLRRLAKNWENIREEL